MVTLSEEDIVQRALLDILSTLTAAEDAVPATEGRKRKEFRSKHWPLNESNRPIDGEPRPTCVHIVERLSSKTMSVCWSDPRLGHFDEQIWRLGRAHSDSVCLVTGKQIQHGDWIFRPRYARGAASGGDDRMILACVVEEEIA
jgi:hypothetical protein